MLVSVVLLAATPPGKNVFTYRVPATMAGSFVVGKMITVPFRSKKELGLICAIVEEEPKYPVKDIGGSVTAGAILSPGLVRFTLAIAERYHASVGHILKSFFPVLGKRRLMEFAHLGQSDAKIPIPPAEPRLVVPDSRESFCNKLVDLLDGGAQNLVIVPEKNYIEAVAGWVTAAVCTSDTGTKDFFALWKDIVSDRPTTIVGTRRALFLPWTNLKKIIVIDAGHPSYKSFDMAPRYQTEDVAEELGRATGAELVFVAATPSVTLFERFKPQLKALPVTVVDMKSERRGGNSTILSEEVDERLAQATGNVLLLHNRNGSAAGVRCRDCGHVWRCLHCKRAYVLYENTHELVCHYCSVRLPFMPTCPTCRSHDIRTLFPGTDTLVAIIKKRPWAKNFTVKKIEVGTQLSSTSSDKPFLLIGTRTVLSALPLDSVSLVVIVDADTPLFIPDYYAVEELWQLLRHIRFWLPPTTPLFAQTSNPEHLLFRSLGNPGELYREEIKARRAFSLPPFATIIRFFLPPTGKIRVSPGLWHKELKSLTLGLKNCTVEAPKQLFVSGKKGQKSWVIMVTIPGRVQENYAVISEIMRHIPDQWKVDINPQSLLSV